MIDRRPRVRYISLGAGVQSTTVALMAAAGDVEADFAVFADTGWEPRAVYAHLEAVRSMLPFDVHVVRQTSLRDVVGNGGYVPVPYFTEGGGAGVRQCTYQFKIRPILSFVKAHLGIDRPWRAGDGYVVQILGLSVDEVHRMRPARQSYVRNVYPLVDAGMTRVDCMAWLRRRGHPIPGKSSCLGCPYHGDAYWRALRDTNPAEWLETVNVERAMRQHQPHSYFHRSLVPLDEVDLGDDGQGDLFGEECEGVCGT